MVDDKEKFCIFVPCHNEEKVIGATVENLSKIIYNPELFDVYFIADNCKDETANAIRNKVEELGLTNFTVFERNVDDPKKKGKPHALRWAMDRLEGEDKFYNKYDMFMVLDADNFVDADILKHVNSQYLSYKESKRPELIQCYLDSKNKNSIIARGYYTSYRITNGFHNYPKYLLGLNSPIGGTGFAMTISFLKEMGGYFCTSLTEDLEIQTIATLKGKTIAFNQFARIYDEKPTGVKQSMVQRTRWAQGHWFICFKYSWRLFLSLFNFKQIKCVLKKMDNLVYLFSMFNIACSGLFLLTSLGIGTANALYKIWGVGQYIDVSINNPVIFIIIFSASIMLYAIILIASLYDGDKKERKYALLEFIPNIIAVFVVSITYIPPAVVGLFKCGNQKTWKKTEHKVTQMNSDNKKEIEKEIEEEVSSFEEIEGQNDTNGENNETADAKDKVIHEQKN